MKAPHIPNYIREFYNPSMREWMRWLRFRRKVTALSKEGVWAMEEYFQKCAKGKFESSSFTRSGMYPGSGSSLRTLDIFEWAWFSRSLCFQGLSLGVSYETRDDIYDIAYANDF